MLSMYKSTHLPLHAYTSIPDVMFYMGVISPSNLAGVKVLLSCYAEIQNIF